MPDSNFWVQIQRITGVDALEAQNAEDFIRKSYLEDVSHIKAVKETDSGTSGKMSDAIDMTVSTINIQAGQFSQTIPLTKEGIELAKGFLDLLGKQIGSKKKEEKPEEKT